MSILQSKRKHLAEERHNLEAKRLALSEQAAVEALRRETAKIDAAEHKRAVYSQTIFPAQHAAKMKTFKVNLSETDLKKHQEDVRVLYEKNVFRKWVTVKSMDAFDKVTHNYGMITDINKLFPTFRSRQCKCSPRLAAFIQNHTAYVVPATGPDPERAMFHLLRTCFIQSHLMFRESWSPYQILLQSDLVIDKAFVLACIYATKWLGIMLLPVGGINQWPPICPEDDGATIS